LGLTLNTFKSSCLAALFILFVDKVQFIPISLLYQSNPQKDEYEKL